MKTLRHTLTTVGLALTTLLTPALTTGCQDDPLFSAPGYDGEGTATKAEPITNPGGLQKQGEYWVATRRVPLVGVGRMVDDIPSNLVELFSDLTDNNLEEMFDTNLGNHTTLNSNFGDVKIGASDGICVKDLYHTYAGGQPVGFVLKFSDPSVLELDVLQSLWIATSLDGDPENDEDWEVIGATQDTELLNLSLLSPQNSGVQTIQVTPTRPFNKIKLGIGGIGVSVLSSLEIYYAFVGENPEVRITTDNFKNPTGKADGTWFLVFPARQSDVDEMFDPSCTGETDGPTYTTIAVAPTVEVDLNGESIPAGSEIGFRTHSGKLLDVSLGGTLLTFNYAENGGQDEQEVDGTGIGLSVLGGGYSTLSAIPNKELPVTKFKCRFGGLNVSLGGATVNYAYYRLPVKTDPSTYYAIPRQARAVTDSYRLPAPTKGTVSYSVISAPTTVSINQITEGTASYYALQGMTEEGTYRIHALYTDTESQEQIAYDIDIVREKEEIPTCHTPITVANYPNALTTTTETSGCLLCIAGGGIDNEHTAANLTDENTYNYAGYTGGIQLANNAGIVAVDAGEEIPAGKKRVGFVMQTTDELLNLGALQFYRIRLLDKDRKEVYNGVTGENSTVGLGLLNGSDGNKIRYSIQTNVAFRYIELYSSGVLTLDLSALHIFYAFWEDYTDNECQEELKGFVPGEAGSILMSASQNNASIWYEETGNPNIATAFNFMTHLSHIVDDNRETSAVIGGTEIIGNTTIGFRFDPLKTGQSVGLLLRSIDGLANASVLTKNQPTIQVYKYANDGGTGENATEVTKLKDDYYGQSGTDNFGLVGLNLIAFGDYAMMEVTPLEDGVDGMILTMNEGVASLLTTYQICGLYYRPDPLGKEPPVENPNGITLTVEPDHICVNNEFTVGAQTMNTSALQQTYYLKCLSGDGKSVGFEVKIEEGKVVRTDGTPFTLSDAGIYSLLLYNSQEEAENESELIAQNAPYLTVHPLSTTWTGVQNHDWNNWSNWTDGSPWTCTNVTIPGGLGDNYPILNADDYNVCANLYINAGGQLVNSFYLDEYDYAWVDVSLPQADRYYMRTAPLRETVSGDWFINTEKNTNWTDFTILDVNTYPEQRTNPTVYQRLWSQNAPVKVPGQNNATIAPDETHWTPPYNSVAQEYTLGMGFSLKVDNGTDNTFRFPKTHTEYSYFDLAGKPTNIKESLTRENSLIGHFIYEEEGTGWKNGTVTVPTGTTDGTAHLVGNPFLAHVNLRQFMTVNGISEVKVFDGAANNSLILVDGNLLSSNGSNLQYIQPLEAFFVMNYTKDDVTYNAEMLSPGDGTAATRSAAPSRPGTALRLAATRDGHTAHALLRVSPGASADVVPGEDTQLLVEGEARPAVAVYTVAGGRALDIQQVPEGPAAIPLGFYLPDGGKADIRLTLDFTDPQWTDWFLVDQRTGQRQRITHTTITLHGVESGSGQYALMKNEE